MSNPFFSGGSAIPSSPSSMPPTPAPPTPGTYAGSSPLPMSSPSMGMGQDSGAPFGSTVAPTPKVSGKVTRAPLGVLVVAAVLSIAGAVLAFFLNSSMLMSLIPWGLASLGFIAVGVFLTMDSKARGKARYIEGNADAVIFKIVVLVGLVCVIIASVQFGLVVGRA